MEEQKYRKKNTASGKVSTCQSLFPTQTPLHQSWC